MSRKKKIFGSLASNPRNPASEAVKLLIWDLDETFWKGTLTEGGITEYLAEHHEIVVELARRGIMSSICSHNSPEHVLPILGEKQILQYFIFPDLSHGPKGSRLASIIDTVKLRPENVMFIDDNPTTRAEALAVVPGLQVEDETFISRLLSDARFKGKDDRALSRLAQYKLMEEREHHRSRSLGDNAEFLRKSNIRVYVEYDILSNIDRAIELINRTSQLNYTKQRLPEDIGKARAVFSEQCSKAAHQAGLIHVTDNYGDYGFVGFYLLRNGRKRLSAEWANQTLIYYCFSCRTLGMELERWLYHWLGRPELDVVGDVLTDLSEEREVDWITVAPSSTEDTSSKPTVAPEFRVYGGCEVHAIAHYLRAHSNSVRLTGNFAAGRMFVRLNSSALLLSACDHAGYELQREVESFGIPYDLLGADYFFEVPTGTVFVFSGAYDAEAGQHRYRHREHGWVLKIEINGMPMNFVTMPDNKMRELENIEFAPEAKKQVNFVATQIRMNYHSVKGVTGLAMIEMMENLLNRVPSGSKFILLLDDERFRASDGKVRVAPWTEKYNEQMRSAMSAFRFVLTVSFRDFVRSEDEIQIGGNHYDRAVYCRVADEIISRINAIECK